MAERKEWWEILRDQLASRGLLDPESERIQEAVSATPAVQRQARGLLSLDPQAESDTVLEMGLGSLPGTGQLMALRDLERARRAKDPGAAAMAATEFVPFGRLLGKGRNAGPIMSKIDVYRGAETAELKPRHFPGVFVSKNRELAQQYGKIHEFDLNESAKILPLESLKTKNLTKEFFIQHPEAEDFLNDSDDPVELFMFPTEEWASFISKKGYDGTSIGDDIFVLDSGKLQLKK
jgi:hypothetical protein